MSWRSERIWIELITGSQKTSNFCWAFILFSGSLGFLLVGTSSYLGRNLLSLLHVLLDVKQIVDLFLSLVESFS